MIDADGALFVNDCSRSSIYRVLADGSTERFVLSGLLRCPNGLAMDDAGNLYVANFGNSAIVQVTPDAEVDILALLPGSNNSHLVFHDGILYAASAAVKTRFSR